jgi:hypothetical protein
MKFVHVVASMDGGLGIELFQDQQDAFYHARLVMDQGCREVNISRKRVHTPPVPSQRTQPIPDKPMGDLETLE